MRNIKLIIEYDGSEYGGWQRQPNNITVQQKIEEAIFKLTKEKVNLIGSSRTDAGVHARGMVANFLTNSTIPEDRFREAINTKLPDDIAILKSEEVDINFHSRYSSKGKMYSYTIINRFEKVSLERRYVYPVKEKLNIEAIREACTYFIGTHDFCAFKSSGGSAKTSVRTIKDLHIECHDEKIVVYISADGFLYNMVRIIVGTLLEVAIGKINPKDIKTIIESKDRTKAGKCVSPNGLVLEKVYYS